MQVSESILGSSAPSRLRPPALIVPSSQDISLNASVVVLVWKPATQSIAEVQALSGSRNVVVGAGIHSALNKGSAPTIIIPVQLQSFSRIFLSCQRLDRRSGRDPHRVQWYPIGILKLPVT